PEPLQSLLARKAKPGETVKLTILTNDSDRLAEELTRRIVASHGTPYLLGGHEGFPNLLYRYAKNDAQVTFKSPERRLFEEMKKHFRVLNDPLPQRHGPLTDEEKGR